MPKKSYAFLLAICEYLAATGRPFSMPFALRWERRLTRPLCQGPHV
jgi:hypothetical protein